MAAGALDVAPSPRTEGPYPTLHREGLRGCGRREEDGCGTRLGEDILAPVTLAEVHGPENISLVGDGDLGGGVPWPQGLLDIRRGCMKELCLLVMALTVLLFCVRRRRHSAKS
jgi:hypothetical protein